MNALPVWIQCCKWPKYDFCISQGSVATVLTYDGQNYSHLRQVFSWCCMRKNYENRQTFYRAIQKVILKPLFETWFSLL